jgi:hypothetical protein
MKNSNNLVKNLKTEPQPILCLVLKRDDQPQEELIAELSQCHQLDKEPLLQLTSSHQETVIDRAELLQLFNHRSRSPTALDRTLLKIERKSAKLCFRFSMTIKSALKVSMEGILML